MNGLTKTRLMYVLLIASLFAYILAYCHHGIRSLHAVRWLRAHGFPRAQSLAGGIDAWTDRVDPALPRY